MRLDVKLTQLYQISRQKAQDALQQGRVFVNSVNVTKNAYDVSDTDCIEMRVREVEFVSRAGYKLDEMLNKHSLDVSGWICIDIGSSTGGFTDCLLQRRVKSVTCVDVGTNQLHSKLRDDPRVTVMENTNARDLDASRFDVAFDLLVMDVSFISVRLLVGNLAALVRPHGKMIVLFKPQFEVGEKYLNKSGIVTSQKAINSSIDSFRQQCRSWQLMVHDCHKSSVIGRDGNQEYVFYLSKI